MTEAPAPPASTDRRHPQAVYALAMLLGLARRRWDLVVASAVVIGLVAAAAALLQAPVYRATSELLVDPLGLQVVGRDIERSDAASSSLDLAGVDSQAYVLTSTPVLRRVVDDLGLADDADYRARAGLLARALGEAGSRDPQERKADAVEILRRDILVKRVEGALVFQITVSAHGAELAARIANAVAASYLRQVAQERVDTVQRVGGSLIGQIAPLRAKLDAAESAVERFRGENALVRSSDTGLVVTQQLKDLYTQIDAAEAERARLDARREQVARMSPDALLSDALPEAVNSASMTSLRTQYAQTAREAASLGQTLMPGHPRMIEIRAELAETRKLLKLELARVRASVAQAADVARANVANLKARATGLTQSKISSSSAEIRLRELESEAKAIRTVYDAALGRSRELEQQQSISPQNSRVLTEAAPPARRSNPAVLVVSAVGALLGACLGFGLAFLVEAWPARRTQRRGSAEAAPPDGQASPDTVLRPVHATAWAAGERRR